MKKKVFYSISAIEWIIRVIECDLDHCSCYESMDSDRQQTYMSGSSLEILEAANHSKPSRTKINAKKILTAAKNANIANGCGKRRAKFAGFVLVYAEPLWKIKLNRIVRVRFWVFQPQNDFLQIRFVLQNILISDEEGRTRLNTSGTPHSEPLYSIGKWNKSHESAKYT